jgi:hypothetical protein
MKAVGLAVAQEDAWRKIAISLTDPFEGVLSVKAC